MIDASPATGEQFCAALGLPCGPRVTISPVARGAMGQVWCLDLGTVRYAVKELFWQADEQAIGREAACTEQFAAAGIRLPRSLQGPGGRLVVRLPAAVGGRWLRYYQWAAGGPVNLADPAVAGLAGDLLGRLHRNAPPPGGQVDPWYETVPDPACWAQLAETGLGLAGTGRAGAGLAGAGLAGAGRAGAGLAGAGRAGTGPAGAGLAGAGRAGAGLAGAGPAEAGRGEAGLAGEPTWAPDLARAVPLLRELTGLVTPAARDELVTCHRDMHPDNVLAGPGPELILLDWDDVGPASPDRELARMLADWFGCDGPADAPVDAAAVRRAMAGYLAAGGPGRVRDERSFGMLIACRLNFLRVQITNLLDPAVAAEHSGFAATEIAFGLANLPTPAMMAELIALAAAG